MEVESTAIAGVVIVRPRVFRDPRGHFLETWARDRYQAAGIAVDFVQDNVSVSARGVIRGLHAQRAPHAQMKLITVVQGSAWDVVVDARSESPTYGQWVSVELSGDTGTQLFIPDGCLHGFQALEDNTVLSYKCSAPYHPGAEVSVRWDDPQLAVAWPIAEVLVSDKDRAAGWFSEMPPLA